LPDARPGALGAVNVDGERLAPAAVEQRRRASARNMIADAMSASAMPAGMRRERMPNRRVEPSGGILYFCDTAAPCLRRFMRSVRFGLDAQTPNKYGFFSLERWPSG
jgi:hypothetical protein